MSTAASKQKSSSLQEILQWSQSKDRPDWQRDALRRVITGKISQSDVDELEKLCLSKHNALDEGETAPVTSPLKAEHIPAEAGNECSISLVSLGSLQHVNRLSPAQTLSFGSTPGLTIVYGDNGAGKSGYARVIKKACRIRGQAEAIEPNAYAKTPPGKASAQFVIHDGNANQPPIVWQDGAAADMRLGQVFLFDAACAEHYVRENEGTTFTPFGLDILDKLSRQLCDPIKVKLDGRIANVNTAIDAAKGGWKYKPHTAVGKVLEGLTAKIKASDIDTVAQWSDTDNIRLTDLQTALASDPKIKSEQTRASAQRIRKFRQSVATIRRTLCEASIARLRVAIDEAQQARKTAQELATGKFEEPSFLPGTGGAIWKNLWNAAREYSVKSAYSGKDFPVIDADARCVFQRGRPRYCSKSSALLPLIG